MDEAAKLLIKQVLDTLSSIAADITAIKEHQATMREFIAHIKERTVENEKNIGELEGKVIIIEQKLAQQESVSGFKRVIGDRVIPAIIGAVSSGIVTIIIFYLTKGGS